MEIYLLSTINELRKFSFSHNFKHTRSLWTIWKLEKWVKNCLLTQKKVPKHELSERKAQNAFSMESRSAHSSWGRLKRTHSHTKLQAQRSGSTEAKEARCWETEIQRQETMQTGSRNTQQIPRLLWTPRFPHVLWDFITQGQKNQDLRS